MEPVHEYPERHVHPVTYVHPEQMIVSEVAEYTPPPRAEVPNSIRPINSAKPDSRIRKNSESGTKAELIPNSSELKPRPTQPIASYKRVGRVGRQRKNEEEGEHGENPVREVVIYRYVRGRQYPALSSDMKRWYEFFYFRKPEQGEKPFNANTNYEQHVEAYERGRRWIEAETASAVGDSRIVDMQARRAIR